MGLFDRVFGRRVGPDARARVIMRRALENARKPQGGYKAATLGADIRDRFFTVVEEVEAQLGGLAIGIAEAEGVLMVHPRLKEKLRKQPDADVLQLALTYCFITKDARRQLNESWPSQVAGYRGRANSDETLREKSALLATYVIYNLDAVELAEEETSDDQDWVVRVEEAAVWYRVIDELAFRFLREQRPLFMDFLQDELALNLALQGSSPDLINRTMDVRSREYAEYPQWVPAKNAGAKGTLLWEAAKHVGEPIGQSANPGFLLQFGMQLLEKLNAALVGELLVGKEAS